LSSQLLQARTPVPAWARRAVGEGVKSCPRAEGVSPKKIAGKNRRTLSHEHTIFRDAIFPDACAWTWLEIGGGKKTPRIFQTEFFFGCLLRTWWGIGGAKKHPPHSALPSHLPAPTLASGGQALGSGASKGQQSIDDRGLAPPVIYGEPPLFDSNRGADSSPRDTYGLWGRPALRPAQALRAASS
jgi:hypothetical protein